MTYERKLIHYLITILVRRTILLGRVAPATFLPHTCANPTEDHQMRKAPGRPRQPERDRKIVEAYKTSTGLEVAAKFGVSLRTVRYVVARSRSK